MDGYLRLGMVNQHKDLLIGDDQCIGGGYYQFDWTSNRLLLDRASYDFGRPRWHLLDTQKAASKREQSQACLSYAEREQARATLKVPASYRGLRIVYTYDDNFHEDYIVSDELKIEYYE
jgi:hypothetical protein